MLLDEGPLKVESCHNLLKEFRLSLLIKNNLNTGMGRWLTGS